MIRRYTIILLLLLILGGLTACTPTSEQEPDPIAVETSNPTNTAVPPTSVPSTTPSPTATATQIRPTVTPSFTPTPLPTLTPQPVIEPTAVGQTTSWSSNALISDDGRFVTFQRFTVNAVGVDMDVFLRDTDAGTTTLINVNLDGRPSHDAYGAMMSGDGRLVAYYSFDGNIVPDDVVECGPVNCEDLFVFDRDTETTTMVPLARPDGLGADNTMGVSSNGRYIAFGHEDNLLLYDHETKVAEPQLTTIDSATPNGRSFAPSLSADGRFIAFVSRASNLVPDDTNEQADVFVLDRDTALIERVSLTNDGGQADGPSGAEPHHEMVNGKTDISGDGRFVTFASASTNLGNDSLIECEDDGGSTRPCYQVYLHDRDTDTTDVISKGGDNDGLDPAVSADGRFIVFTSMASNLTAATLPTCEHAYVVICGHIYLFDRQTGELLLLTGQANGGSWSADVSGNGRYITFTSNASNLVPADSNGQSDIFRYDRDTGQFERISLANLP